MAQYVRTDECLDILASLEHCVLSLRQAQTSSGAWKWVVLSFHNALQGAMVCHLSGTAQLGALTRSNAAKWLEWHDRDRRGEVRRVQQGIDEFGTPIERTRREDDQPPREYVANAKELFNRLSNTSKRIEAVCGGIIPVTREQRKAFERLHHLRNELSHFSPKGWSIEVQLISESIDTLLDVLCLILGDHWPFRHMSPAHKKHLYRQIEDIRSIVS